MRNEKIYFFFFYSFLSIIVAVYNPIKDIVQNTKHISKVNSNPYSFTNFVNKIVDVIRPPQIKAVSMLLIIHVTVTYMQMQLL